MTPTTKTASKFEIVKRASSFVGLAVLLGALPLGVLGLAISGPLTALAAAASSGGIMGIAASVVCLFGGGKDSSLRGHSGTRIATATLCAAACLGLNQVGRATAQAQQDIHGVLTAAATQAFEPAGAAHMQTAARVRTTSAAPLLIIAARPDRPVSA